MGVAALITDMVRSGVDPELIGRTAELLCERDAVPVVDEQAERRRAKDRERKRLRKSAESAENETTKEIPPTPPKENNNNINKPIAREAEKIRTELESVLSPELAQAVIDHRKKLKKPLTVTAARLLAGKFGNCRDGPQAAAEAMILNGWQGFNPDWMENAKRNSNNGNGSNPTGKVDGLRQLLDAAKEYDRRGGESPGGHGEGPQRRALGVG